MSTRRPVQPTIDTHYNNMLVYNVYSLQIANDRLNIYIPNSYKIIYICIKCDYGTNAYFCLSDLIIFNVNSINEHY